MRSVPYCKIEEKHWENDGSMLDLSALFLVALASWLAIASAVAFSLAGNGKDALSFFLFFAAGALTYSAVSYFGMALYKYLSVSWRETISNLNELDLRKDDCEEFGFRR